MPYHARLLTLTLAYNIKKRLGIYPRKTLYRIHMHSQWNGWKHCYLILTKLVYINAVIFAKHQNKISGKMWKTFKKTTALFYGFFVVFIYSTGKTSISPLVCFVFVFAQPWPTLYYCISYSSLCAYKLIKNIWKYIYTCGIYTSCLSFSIYHLLYSCFFFHEFFFSLDQFLLFCLRTIIFSNATCLSVNYTVQQNNGQ